MCSSPEPDLVAFEMEKLSIDSTKAALKDKLNHHKLYFISWLRDEKITKDNIQKTLVKLYDTVPRVSLDKENFKAYFATLQLTTIQSVGCGLIEAYFHICTLEFEKCRGIIELVEKYLEHGGLIIPKDYLNGFGLVISMLKFHLSLEEHGTFESEDLPLGEDESKLKPVELAAILSLHWEINELFISRRLEGIEVLEKMCKLDPNYWVWSYILCLRVRFVRRSEIFNMRTTQPDPREISAIWSSISTAPDHFRPIPEAGMCLALAEILRWRCMNSKYENEKELTFGPLTFHSNAEIAQYILDTSKKALENKHIVFGELIRYGEILSATMPHEYLDPDTAEKCYKRARLDWPRNSKINHKLGSFFMKFRKDKAMAVVYLEDAVEYSVTNFQAWMELTSIRISEIKDEKNICRLKEIFSKLLQPDIKWENKGQTAGILFQYGLFNLLTGDTEAAISAWLQRAAVDPSDNYPSFHDIPSILKRYSFNREIQLAPLLEKIVETIKLKLRTSPDEELEKLMKKLKEVKVNRSHQPQRQYRNSFNDNYNNYEAKGKKIRPKAPSAADSDNCWRNSASTPPRASGFENQSYHERSNYSRNRNSNSGGSGDWNYQRQRPRSPSPDSWRKN